MWTSCSVQVISIYGESNSLLKRRYIKFFYTMNGKIKVICQSHNGNAANVVNHGADLFEIFGKGIVDETSIY